MLNDPAPTIACADGRPQAVVLQGGGRSCRIVRWWRPKQEKLPLDVLHAAQATGLVAGRAVRRYSDVRLRMFRTPVPNFIRDSEATRQQLHMQIGIM